MNVNKYLARIKTTGAQSPNAETLAYLQRRHLLNVPFENLDIHWNRRIVLDVEQFYQKIVENGRGGFCYELNGLFNELLTEIGFETYLVSARVFNGKTHGPEYDHAAIIVTIGKEKYLADVGFGDFTAEPLRFQFDIEQQDANGIFTIRGHGEEYIDVAKLNDGDEWRSEYIFKDKPRNLAEFAEMCDFQQYSSESHFTKGKLCSIMTENGRRTLTDGKLLVTTDDQKKEMPVTSEPEFNALLESEFNILRKPSDVK